MLLNHIPHLRTEDFPDQQEWIGKLFIQFNPFILATQQLFNNNIDYATNIKSVTKQILIKEFETIKIGWPYNDVNPQSLQIIQATKGNSPVPTILLAAWNFNASTREANILSMVEVSAGSVTSLSGTYNFTVRVTI